MIGLKEVGYSLNKSSDKVERRKESSLDFELRIHNTLPGLRRLVGSSALFIAVMVSIAPRPSSF